MRDNAVVVEGLAKRFGEVVALDGIDFEVSGGSVFGLLGPNGAGKTTPSASSPPSCAPTAATLAVRDPSMDDVFLLERFRSLPMARSAVLAGRTFADLARNVFVTALMAAVGFAVGFRVHTGALAFLGAMGLVLLFGYALSWVFATVGLAVGDPETAQAAAFPVLAPLVFASTVFVPASSMPSWLQPFAEHQPVSVTAAAVRALVIGGPTTSYVLQSLAWSVGILLVFGPIAVRRYRRTV